MSLSKKLMNVYLGEKRQYTSPLERFIISLGKPYNDMSRKEIDSFGRLKRYKQWKKLQKIKRIENENPTLQKEDMRYKHIDPTHISQKRAIASLIAHGFSPEQIPITASKQTRFGRSRLRVGKRTYLPLAKGHARFRELTFDPKKKGRTKTIRILKRQQEFKGKAARMFSNYEQEYKSVIFESVVQAPTYDEKVANAQPEDTNKVAKLVNTNKKLKAQTGTDAEIKLPKTMTGEKDTNTIEINPRIDTKNAIGALLPKV